jgi:hypothetical protein
MRQISARISDESFIRLGSIVSRKKVQKKTTQERVIGEALEKFIDSNEKLEWNDDMKAFSVVEAEGREDDRLFKISCVDCGAIQIFRLRNGELSLIRSEHQS